MRASISLLLLLFLPSLAGSQTVYNARYIEFSSPDHETLVSAYTVEYWLEGVDPATGSPYQVMTLAKTSLNLEGGVYRASLSSLQPLPVIPVGKNFKATVTAIGLDTSLKSPRSGLSNPFALAPAPASPASVSIR